MKRLIRDKATGDYLCVDGSWGQNYSAATDFSDTLSLLDATRSLDRTNLEEVLMINDCPSGLDVALSLYVTV